MSGKVSVCATVFNEENTIEELLQSLFNQSRKANEIIICDAGSRDRTVGVIKKLQKKYKYVKLIISPGPVAHGRNAAIRNAQYKIIASIDAGCIAKRDWLEKLLRQFKPGKEAGTGSQFGMTKDTEVDIVAGFYEMKWKTPFQRIMALYRGTPQERYDKNTFIPSCRSVAFKKSVWKDIGGFNETLELSGEDTQFFFRAMQKGKKMVRVKSALVEWKEPEQFGFRDFKKFFYYARGDAQTGIWWDPIKKWKTHNIKILTIFIRYIVLTAFLLLSFESFTYLLLFVLCSMFYVLWAILKWRDVVTKWSERFWIPVVQIGTDIMVMSGFVAGITR